MMIVVPNGLVDLFMKKLIRLCLSAALLVTALNTHATGTSPNIFDVKNQFSNTFIKLNRNLSIPAVYSGNFVFSPLPLGYWLEASANGSLRFLGLAADARTASSANEGTLRSVSFALEDIALGIPKTASALETATVTDSVSALTLL